MTIEQTIKKAIEGGWKKEFVVEPMDTPQANFAKAMIDPLFWQALGKAMGWTGTTYIQMGTKINELSPDWKYQWHCFIDHLAEGKSIESYFEEL